MFNVDGIKKKLLNATANCGCKQLAMNQCSLMYTELLELESDQTYAKQLKEAEKFYVTNLNKIIAALAKKELYNLLVNGQIHVVTKTTSFTTEDGDKVVKQEITRKYNGKPIAAIKLGLEMLPELVRLAEGMASHNALDIDQLTALESYLTDKEDGARQALKGDVEVKPLTDDVIGNLQSILLTGN